MLLPKSFFLARNDLFDKTVFPKRKREGIERVDENPLIQDIVQAANRSTKRLLRSIDELEREALAHASQTDVSHASCYVEPDPYWVSYSEFGDIWSEYWTRSRERARGVHVPENELTKEFINARSSAQGGSWDFYYLVRRVRNKWAQYLHSNMDWDWDLGACIDNLFRLGNQVKTISSPAVHCAPMSSSAVVIALLPRDLRKALTYEVLPNEEQIARETEHGEVRYISFVPSPSPGPRSPYNAETVRARPSIEKVLCPEVVQQDVGHREGGEQEIEDLQTGTSSYDVSQVRKSEETSAEASDDDWKGKATVCDVQPYEVRSGEDMLSICSLD